MRKQSYNVPTCEVVLSRLELDLMNSDAGNSNQGATFDKETTVDTNYGNGSSIFDNTDYGDWENK